MILSLDADFLGDGPEQTRLSREFAARREPSAEMNRLYVVEPAMTVTGTIADHRLRLRGVDVGGFAAALCAMLAGRGLAALAPLSSLSPGAGTAAAGPGIRSGWSPSPLTSRRSAAAAWSSPAAASRRRCTRWSYALNAALGNVGATVELRRAR